MQELSIIQIFRQRSYRDQAYLVDLISLRAILYLFQLPALFPVMKPGRLLQTIAADLESGFLRNGLLLLLLSNRK